MNILVTGASGFLGRHLCDRLTSSGHTVTPLNSRNCDLCDSRSLTAFHHYQYDVIYHLAAWTQAGDFCLYHPGEQWTINQAINTNMLTWWQTHQPRAKLVAMGTSCSYAPSQELVEDNYLEGTPIESLYTYAMTKRMLLVGLRALQKQYGMRYLYLVPSTLYGPGYHPGGKQLHFVFDLIQKIAEAKTQGVPPVLWGDGFQKRELVHVRDFVDAAIALVDRVDDNLVNIGGGREFTIREFADQICHIVGYDPALIQYDESRYVGARSKVLSIEKFRSLLPDFEFRSLAEGLIETVHWFTGTYRTATGDGS